MIVQIACHVARSGRIDPAVVVAGWYTKIAGIQGNVLLRKEHGRLATRGVRIYRLFLVIIA
jgi:hypothetical protein